MDNIDIQEYFMKRRTVRRFSDRPLTDAELRRVLTAAAKAPTCGNMQLYSIILPPDPKARSSSPSSISASRPQRPRPY